MDFLFCQNEPAESAPIESGIIDKLSYEAPHLPPREPQPVVHIEDVDDSDESMNYNVYDDIRAYERHGTPGVLMPVAGGYYETYLSPLLTMLYRVPVLRQKVFAHGFSTLGFDERWFKGELVKADDEHRFLIEIQRIFAFLSDESRRSFASLANLVKSFPKSSLQSLAHVDNLEESYEIFYKTLVKELESVDQPSLDLFESTLYDSSSNETRKFGMFHIEAEEMKRTMYKSLHELIWGDWADTTPVITQLSDVVMINIDSCPEDMFATQSMEISAEFYPQIYTEEFREIVTETKSRYDAIETQRAELNKKLLKLKTYKGKHVQSMLDHSLEFLHEESGNESLDDLGMPNVIADIEELQTDLHQQREELAELNNKLMEERHLQNPFNINSLIEQYEQVNGSAPEPYILTGVILSGTTYCFLESNGTQWRYVDHTAGENGAKFNSDLLDFDEIRTAVYSRTSNVWKDPLVFVYVKKSVYLAQLGVEMPASVREFLKQDGEALDQTNKWIDSEGDLEDALIDLSDESDMSESDEMSEEEEEGRAELADDEDLEGEHNKDSENRKENNARLEESFE